MGLWGVVAARLEHAEPRPNRLRALVPRPLLRVEHPRGVGPALDQIDQQADEGQQVLVLLLALWAAPVGRHVWVLWYMLRGLCGRAAAAAGAHRDLPSGSPCVDMYSMFLSASEIDCQLPRAELGRHCC